MRASDNLRAIHALEGASVLSGGIAPPVDGCDYAYLNVRLASGSLARVWIQQDPEGNPGGFLDVEEVGR